MPRESNVEPLRRLRELFRESGLRAALVFLNSMTKHRFTSLFRFDGDALRCVTLVDRENPDVESSPDIPVNASYCVFVREQGAKISIDHARADARTVGHPKRETVQRYCGVPLVDREGRLFGTVCHFDFEPGRVDAIDVHLLEELAEILRASPIPLDRPRSS